MLDIFFQAIYDFRILAAASPGGCDMAVWICKALRLKFPEPPKLFTRPFLCGLVISGGVINRKIAEESMCDPVDPILVKGLLADLADRDLIRIRKFDPGPAGQLYIARRKFPGKGACLRNLQTFGKRISAGRAGTAAAGGIAAAVAGTGIAVVGGIAAAGRLVVRLLRIFRIVSFLVAVCIQFSLFLYMDVLFGLFAAACGNTDRQHGEEKQQEYPFQRYYLFPTKIPFYYTV